MHKSDKPTTKSRQVLPNFKNNLNYISFNSINTSFVLQQGVSSDINHNIKWFHLCRLTVYFM